MGKLELSQIKLILQNTSSEIITVQKEALRDHGNISDQKIEKLKKLLGESETALVELKKIKVKTSPVIQSAELQKLIDNMLNVRAGSSVNPAVLQAVLSGLQSINRNLGDITIGEKDHKRGERVEEVGEMDHERQ